MAARRVFVRELAELFFRIAQSSANAYGGRSGEAGEHLAVAEAADFDRILLGDDVGERGPGHRRRGPLAVANGR